jgi:D-sedoheptulose 7-phosphate isomerase
VTSVLERWSEYTDTIAAGLQQMAVTDATGGDVPVEDAFAQWVDLTHALHARGAQLFLVGNGGSAAMASHMATDALALAGLRAFALNDVTTITAAANDASFDRSFALQIETLAREGDMLVAISQSGNSANIVRAIEAAGARGATVVTLSAMAAANRCRALGRLNFHVPLARYGWAQSAHQIVLHYWFDRYLARYGKGPV